MTAPILVVDIGTSVSTATIVSEQRAIPLRDPHTGTNAWPSSLCLEDGGQAVGTAAERRKRAAPRRYIDAPRRAVDAQAAMWLDQREVTGHEALTAYLSALAAEARQIHGSPIFRLLLTVPADYAVPDPRRDAMIAIGEAAGFTDVELITDSVATALDPYNGTDLPDDALVLVCDLGANWTVGLVRLAGDRPTQLGQVTFPAGRDLDTVLINDLRTEGRAWLEPMLGTPGDAGLRAYYEAIDFVRRLKHRLSADEEVQDHLTPLCPPYRLTRQWLEAFAAPAVRSLVSGCQSVAAGAGVQLDDVAAVVVAGGASRMPLVAATLADALGRQLHHSAEPEFAAVRGATRWASRARSRVVAAAVPPWRVEPLTWELPGDQARLLHWTVPEDQAFTAGSVVAEVRGTGELVHELVAPRPGRLLAPRPAPGSLVGPVLAVPAARDPRLLADESPPRLGRLASAGPWLLSPDRQHLHCYDAGVVRTYHVDTATPVRELPVQTDGGAPPGQVRFFVGPSGQPALVAWDADRGVWVFDINSGKVSTRLPEATGAATVLVDESAWRLAVEAESRSTAGRYRRRTVTTWELSTGQRLDRLTDDTWRHRHPGYREHSLADRFAEHVLSPDQQLRATAHGATVTLTDNAAGTELFRTNGPAGARARVAFGGTAGLLLTCWEHDGGNRVDVWAV